MGKKGVMLDNGKNAQSSMALYWKKHHEQAKKPKKQYQPTQQQQMDQRVESGFQKWKMHKEKMISKTYEKVEKQTTKEKNEVNKQADEIQEQQLFEKKEKKGPIHIPGFKSKQALEKKLKIENKKEVNQSDNVLKLPPHMANISQDDILHILRQKKAQSDMHKRKKNLQQKSDIMLADNFIEAFKPDLKSEQNQIKQVPIEKEVVPEEQQFFKSAILNQISKGNYAVLLPKDVEVQQKVKQQEAPKEDLEKKGETEMKQQTQHHIKPLFKPRVLANKK